MSVARAGAAGVMLGIMFGIALGGIALGTAQAQAPACEDRQTRALEALAEQSRRQAAALERIAERLR